MPDHDGAYIDYRDLRSVTVIIVYWLILTASTIIGVVVGTMILMATVLPAAMAAIGGSGGLFLALAAGIQGFVVAIVGVSVVLIIGIIVVPLAATLAGILHSHFSARYIGSLFLLSEPTPADQLGSSVIALSKRLRMPPPGVSIIADDVVNAFAMGSSKNGVISIGRPLIQNFAPDELDAIIGHELGHIANMDSTRSIFSRSFQHWLSFFLVFNGLQKFARWLITPLGEMLLMYNSRHREYWADAIGAFLTSKDSMIRALKRIEELNAPKTKVEARYADLMFNGFSNGLFRTHPKTIDRIKALEEETYIRRLPVRQNSSMGSGVNPNIATDAYTSGI